MNGWVKFELMRVKGERSDFMKFLSECMQWLETHK